MEKSFDFPFLAGKIKSAGAHGTIVLAGAGMSTSAGIPDFRGPSGLYALFKDGNFQGVPISSLLPPGLPVDAVFSIALFRLKPEIFYRVAAAIKTTLFAAKPTPTHYFVRVLTERGLVRRIFTQNVDGLERVAGIDTSLLVEAHGTFQTASCLECRQKYNMAWLNSKVGDSPDNISVPLCDICQGLVKPDVVLFGEGLPDMFFTHARSDLSAAKVLLILGTSLTVNPFNSLPSAVPPICDRVFVSFDGSSPPLRDWQSRSPGSGRDMTFHGSCDDFARFLAQALGEEQALAALTEQ